MAIKIIKNKTIVLPIDEEIYKAFLKEKLLIHE
jgi:hypothetical protein